MKTIFLYLLLGVLAFSSLSGQYQEQHYEMKALGSNIGSLTSTMEKVGEDYYYRNATVLEVNLIFKKIHMLVKNESHYRNGKLLRAENRVVVNDELHSSSKIEWQGQAYHIVINEETQPPMAEPINWSGSLFYYWEPVGISQVFSESSGVYMPVVSLGEGKYKVTDPKNDRDMIRHYENGRQVKVEMKHTLLTIYLIRTDSTNTTEP